MGKIVERNQPCLREECGSSDARQIYEDGSSFCFSCKHNFPANSKLNNPVDADVQAAEMDWTSMTSLSEVEELTTRGIAERGITKVVCEFFGVKMSYSTDGKMDSHYYPYGKNKIVGYKQRKLPKTFFTVGTIDGLFGQSKFNGGKRLVITEGEIDALTVAQAYMEHHKQVYPVVSVSSAAWGKTLLEERDWIRGFEEVVLWFDDDEPGHRLLEEATRIIGGRILIAKSSYKDASETFVKSSTVDARGIFVPNTGSKAVLQAIWNARAWSPAGIVYSADTWTHYKSAEDREYTPYAPCLAVVNENNYGRRRGSITMFTSGTGMGKSQLLKEDQYFLHQYLSNDHKIGILSLEESIAETVAGLMAIDANKRIQLPDVEVTEEEERQYWENTMGSNRYILLDHQGSIDDGSLTSKIEFMILSGCSYLYLDHITIAINAAGDDNVNSATDKLLSDLLKIVKRFNVWIGVVCHLRKTPNTQKSFEEGAVPSDDDLKGSGSLKQVPAQIIALSRNKLEQDPTEKNTSYVWVLKDRFTGRTGPAGSFVFDDKTGRCVANDPMSGFQATPTATENGE